LRDHHRRCCSKCPVSDQPSIPFLYWRLESTPRRDSVTIGSDLKPKIDSWEQYQKQNKRRLCTLISPPLPSWTLFFLKRPVKKKESFDVLWTRKVFCIMITSLSYRFS
jgi:hypothetical protein